MRNKKTVSVLSILLIIVLMLSGCRGNVLSTNTESQAKEETTSQTDTENELTETRDVVFLNKVYSRLINAATLSHNEMYSLYETETDSNTLYAFEVKVSCYRNEAGAIMYPDDYPIQAENEEREAYLSRCGEYEDKAIKELLRQEGFIFIDDYPSKGIVIAGTLNQVERVFKDMENLNGWYIGASSALRPDMDDILKEAGWRNDLTTSISKTDWFEKNMDILKQLLGTDANQVTLTVPVIVPDNTTETK